MLIIGFLRRKSWNQMKVGFFVDLFLYSGKVKREMLSFKSIWAQWEMYIWYFRHSLTHSQSFHLSHFSSHMILKSRRGKVRWRSGCCWWWLAKLMLEVGKGKQRVLPRVWLLPRTDSTATAHSGWDLDPSQLSRLRPGESGDLTNCDYTITETWRHSH